MIWLWNYELWTTVSGASRFLDNPIFSIFLWCKNLSGFRKSSHSLWHFFQWVS
jgi:hypothetical protein